MPWVKVDDNLPNHPKILRRGSLALALMVSALAYCQRNLTDGFVPKQAIQTLVPDLRRDKGRALAELMSTRLPGETSGLFEAVEGGYRIHDYHDYNPAAQDVLAMRARRADNTRRWRRDRLHHDHAPMTVIGPNLSPTPTPTPTPTPKKKLEARSNSIRDLTVADSPAFEVFWEQYPKKVGKDEARRAWRVKGCEAIADRVTAAVMAQHAYLCREGKRFCPNPATWLNQGRWQDEPPAPSPFGQGRDAANADVLRRYSERGRPTLEGDGAAGRRLSDGADGGDGGGV